MQSLCKQPVRVDETLRAHHAHLSQGSREAKGIRKEHMRDEREASGDGLRQKEVESETQHQITFDRPCCTDPLSAVAPWTTITVPSMASKLLSRPERQRRQTLLSHLQIPPVSKQRTNTMPTLLNLQQVTHNIRTILFQSFNFFRLIRASNR